jgi:hypothetical protein
MNLAGTSISAKATKRAKLVDGVNGVTAEAGRASRLRSASTSNDTYTRACAAMRRTLEERLCAYAAFTNEPCLLLLGHQDGIGVEAACLLPLGGDQDGTQWASYDTVLPLIDDRIESGGGAKGDGEIENLAHTANAAATAFAACSHFSISLRRVASA